MTPQMFKFKNAELQLQALRQELMRSGLAVQASRLMSLEVNCPETAKVAHDIVNHLPLFNGHTPRGVAEMKKHTLRQLLAAIG